MAAAFASAKLGRSIFGDKVVRWGTYTASGGSTGGNIDTGLTSCQYVSVQAGGASIVADAPTVNETLPCAGSAVTVIITADTTGYWWALGTE